MSWLILFVAGLLEVAWAVGLKYTDGFSRPAPSLMTVGAIAASMWLLSVAARTLPIGTAYAVWVGIGATGTAILGWLLFDEPMRLGRVGFLMCIVVGVIGLRFTSAS